MEINGRLKEYGHVKTKNLPPIILLYGHFLFRGDTKPAFLASFVFSPK